MGDLFFENWDNAKTTKWSQRVNDPILKASNEKVTPSTNNKDAKYKIILVLKNMKLSKRQYFGKQPATVDFELLIVDNNPSNILAKG